MRDQYYDLQRQFASNLNSMKADAQKLDIEKNITQQELGLMRKHGERWKRADVSEEMRRAQMRNGFHSKVGVSAGQQILDQVWMPSSHFNSREVSPERNVNNHLTSSNLLNVKYHSGKNEQE